ncbi:unnamed protein product [Eretmochelys imbricata]
MFSEASPRKATWGQKLTPVHSSRSTPQYAYTAGECYGHLDQDFFTITQCQKDLQLVDKIMKDLDTNKDNEVDFNEFVILVAALTVACNDFFEEQLKQKEIGNDK